LHDRSFFQEHLGFRLSEHIVMDDDREAGAWLRVTSKSYDLVFTEDATGARGPLHHLAYRLDNGEDVLRAIIGEMEQRLAEGDLLGIFEANTRLDSRLLRIANNKTVSRLIERLRAQHIRSQFRIILVPGRPPQSVAEHRAIVEAVASRDPDAAEAAMRDHLTHVVQTLRILAATRPPNR
jgi:DNA-binding GntR family transcriptional regulator